MSRRLLWIGALAVALFVGIGIGSTTGTSSRADTTIVSRVIITAGRVTVAANPTRVPASSHARPGRKLVLFRISGAGIQDLGPFTTSRPRILRWRLVSDPASVGFSLSDQAGSGPPVLVSASAGRASGGIYLRAGEHHLETNTDGHWTIIIT